MTTLALFIGLAAVNLVKPGVGIQLGASTTEGEQFASTQTTLSGVLEHTVPASFFDAAAKNEVLQVVFFSILFAAGLSQVKGKRRRRRCSRSARACSEVMFKFTNIVMKFAPIGIAAAIAVTIGKNGLERARATSAMLVLTLYGALIVFVLGGLVPVAL